MLCGECKKSPRPDLCLQRIFSFTGREKTSSESAEWLDKAGVFPQSSGMGSMVFQVLGTDNQMNVDLLALRAGVSSVGDEGKADRARWWNECTGLCYCHETN